ncbi:MAG TPA: hypothetical protein VFM29_07050, partial [Vicinamibacteria bacterium]|nr:hypothetical protein [Vicinamibacteria bacterium]
DGGGAAAVRMTSARAGTGLSVLSAVVLASCGGGGGAGGSAAPAAKTAGASFERAQEWIRKAASAPLPTAPPAPSPLPPNWVPEPPPEFKTEEVEAIRLLEETVAGQPAHGAAHRSLGDLLGPHAIRRFDRRREEQARRTAGRRATPAPQPSDQGVDWSDERVVRAYRGAIEADPTSTDAVEALIRFADRVDRFDDADAGYRELLKRVRESPEPHVRYGDFLKDRRKDPFAAVEQYRQALIWKPDDEETRRKVAEIYLDMAATHLTRREYAAADDRVREAAKYVTDGSTPTGRRLKDYQDRLRDIRR